MNEYIIMCTLKYDKDAPTGSLIKWLGKDGQWNPKLLPVDDNDAITFSSVESAIGFWNIQSKKYINKYNIRNAYVAIKDCYLKVQKLPLKFSYNGYLPCTYLELPTVYYFAIHYSKPDGEEVKWGYLGELDGFWTEVNRDGAIKFSTLDAARAFYKRYKYDIKYWYGRRLLNIQIMKNWNEFVEECHY